MYECLSYHIVQNDSLMKLIVYVNNWISQNLIILKLSHWFISFLWNDTQRIFLSMLYLMFAYIAFLTQPVKILFFLKDLLYVLYNKIHKFTIWSRLLRVANYVLLTNLRLWTECISVHQHIKIVFWTTFIYHFGISYENIW